MADPRDTKGGADFLEQVEHDEGAESKKVLLRGNTGSGFVDALLTADGELVVSNGAMQIISTGLLTPTNGNTASVAVPANAYGGIYIGCVGTQVVRVSFETDRTANGFKLSAGEERSFPLRDTTCYVHNPGPSPSTVYYIISGEPT